MPTLSARFLVAAALLSLTPRTAAPQQWDTWSAYWENDSFAFWDGSDARYTNGVRFTIRDAESWGITDRLASSRLRALFLGETAGTIENTVVLGQNFFTPNLITDYYDNPIDRPFAGYLYGGVRIDFTEPVPEEGTSSRRSQHSLEVHVGVLGQPSLAETFQKTIHILRENRIPKGWDHQLRTEPAVQLAYDYRTQLRFPIRGSIGVDVTPTIGGSLGTVQTVARIGGTLRLGNVQGFTSSVIAATADRTEAREGFRWAIYGGYEFRAFAHNAFVDGGLIRGGTGLDSEPWINELRYGFMLRAGRWGLDYTRVHHRDAEFDTPPQLGVGEGDHRFGSFILSYDLAGSLRTDETTNWWFRDWVFEISMGAGRSWEKSTVGDAPAQSGAAVRVGAAKGLTEKFLLGAELGGVIYERGRPDALDRHYDDFYVTKAFTFGWRPWGRERFFVVRTGLGWGVVRTQETTIQAATETSRVFTRVNRDVGALVGLSYGYPLGSTASLGLDLTWGDIFVADDQDGPAASYLSWGLGVKWHP